MHTLSGIHASTQHLIYRTGGLSNFDMARLDWFMMLLVLVMTPLSMLVTRFIARKSYQLYRNQTKWRGKQTQLIEESLTQEALVQILNAQDQMVLNFNEVNGKYANYSQGAIFYSSAVNPATRFFNSLLYALITGFGKFPKRNCEIGRASCRERV